MCRMTVIATAALLAALGLACACSPQGSAEAPAAPTTISIRAWTTSGRSLSQSTAPM